jgi:hypothetical protein
METPSEWAKRFNQPKTDEKADLPKNTEAVSVDAAAATAEFPSEPFPCPACGQLLGPSCRVCVSCKRPINPAEIARPREVALSAAYGPTQQLPRTEQVRFSWPIFFAVLGVSCLIALILQGLLKDQQQVLLAMGGVQTLAGVWVFFDAQRRGVPNPLRWSICTLFLPMVIFPWYLTRRRTPQLPVPFLEAVPIARLLLIALLFFLLLNLIVYIVQGPPHAPPQTPQPQIQKSVETPPTRITGLRPWKAGGPRNWPSEESCLRLAAASAQPASLSKLRFGN